MYWQTRLVTQNFKAQFLAFQKRLCYFPPSISYQTILGKAYGWGWLSNAEADHWNVLLHALLMPSGIHRYLLPEIPDWGNNVMRYLRVPRQSHLVEFVEVSSTPFSASFEAMTDRIVQEHIKWGSSGVSIQQDALIELFTAGLLRCQLFSDDMPNVDLTIPAENHFSIGWGFHVPMYTYPFDKSTRAKCQTNVAQYWITTGNELRRQSGASDTKYTDG